MKGFAQERRHSSALAMEFRVFLALTHQYVTYLYIDGLV